LVFDFIRLFVVGDHIGQNIPLSGLRTFRTVQIETLSTTIYF